MIDGEKKEYYKHCCTMYVYALLLYTSIRGRVALHTAVYSIPIIIPLEDCAGFFERLWNDDAGIYCCCTRSRALHTYSKYILKYSTRTSTHITACGRTIDMIRVVLWYYSSSSSSSSRTLCSLSDGGLRPPVLYDTWCDTYACMDAWSSAY